MPVRCPECDIPLTSNEAARGECPSCRAILDEPPRTGRRGDDRDYWRQREPGENIGGWLIFPAIGLIIGPIINLIAVINDVALLTGTELMMARQRFPGIDTLIVTEIVLQAALVLYQVVVAAMFFQKKAIASMLVIIMLLVNVGIGIGMYVWTLKVIKLMPPGSERGLIMAAVAAIIWVPYFAVSQRVKRTFVR